jgi:hypothetical protein
VLNTEQKRKNPPKNIINWVSGSRQTRLSLKRKNVFNELCEGLEAKTSFIEIKEIKENIIDGFKKILNCKIFTKYCHYTPCTKSRSRIEQKCLDLDPYQ